MPRPGGDSDLPGANPATLELHMSRTGIDQYGAELRFTGANDETIHLVRGLEILRFENSRGTDAAVDPEGVGDKLTAELFADEQIADEFRRVLAITENGGDELHVRLFIDPSAAELQLLPWEALRHPDRPSFLFLGERISFSRFLASSDYRQVPPLARRTLTASVIVANPEGLEKYRLACLDVDGLRSSAEVALAGLRVRQAPAAGPATLAALVEEARSGVDILYLVCHGSMPEGQAVLWLEDEEGKIARVPGSALIEQLRSLRALPRVVVLFSCGSGGDDIAFHSALGPGLAEAGVPAVVAMRGDVPLDSGAKFIASLLEELTSHGSIDRAVAYARRAMPMGGEALIPMLFSRLRGGRIWYRPGFVPDGSDLGERWQTLVDRINRNQCLPIIGPGLSEPLLGSSRDLARKWAEDCGFPLAPHARDNLAQVAQYLVISQDGNRPRELLEEHVRSAIAAYEPANSSDMDGAPLMERIGVAWQQYAQKTGIDPFRLLAELPFSIYVTTNSDGLIEQALRQAGREPVSEVCRWDGKDYSPTVFEGNPPYLPTRQRPLVYHLFRMLREDDERFPAALLTEDNYFDYLLGMTSRRELIPSKVRAALTDRALLFLGFQIDELDFRVLFRSIINQDNLASLRLYNHVAVQVDPEEGRIIEPDRARRFLVQYFKELANVSVYWGSAADFVKQAYDEWKALTPRTDTK